VEANFVPFVGVLFAALEDDGCTSATGEDFAAGEKSIFVWRLRPRAFFGGIFPVPK
jgi:hypothetical protein